MRAARGADNHDVHDIVKMDETMRTSEKVLTAWWIVLWGGTLVSATGTAGSVHVQST